MTEKKYVMTEEMARSEIEKWMDDNDIEVDAKEVDSGAMTASLVKAMQRGLLVVGDDGLLEYEVSKRTRDEKIAGQKVKINPPTVKAFSAVTKKNDNPMAGITAAAAMMTGKETVWFDRLDVADYKVFMNAVSLFLLKV